MVFKILNTHNKYISLIFSNFFSFVKIMNIPKCNFFVSVNCSQYLFFIIERKIASKNFSARDFRTLKF